MSRNDSLFIITSGGKLTDESRAALTEFVDTSHHTMAVIDGIPSEITALSSGTTYVMSPKNSGDRFTRQVQAYAPVKFAQKGIDILLVQTPCDVTDLGPRQPALRGVLSKVNLDGMFVEVLPDQFGVSWAKGDAVEIHPVGTAARLAALERGPA